MTVFIRRNTPNTSLLKQQADLHDYLLWIIQSGTHPCITVSYVHEQYDIINILLMFFDLQLNSDQEYEEILE